MGRRPLPALRILLGLDVVDGELRAGASLPTGMKTLRLRGVPVGGKQMDTH